MKRIKFKVEVDMPKGCTVADMREYIEESVATWRGCKHPEDPVFDLNWETVTVTRLLEKRKKIINKNKEGRAKWKSQPELDLSYTEVPDQVIMPSL